MTGGEGEDIAAALRAARGRGAARGALLLAFLTVALAAPAHAADFRDFAPVEQPVHVTSPPDDPSRVFIVGMAGQIHVVKDGVLQPDPFLDITADVHRDGLYGLLSMAFAPDYAHSRRFYVFYSDRQNRTVIEEFKRTRKDPNRASLLSRREVLTLDLPTPDGHGEPHLGGQLAFGPDGFLYISIGDASRGYADEVVGQNGQKLGNLFGKLLRIDPVAFGRPYRVPKSNPFVGRRGRDEIYAAGLRNPWRFTFGHDRIALSDAGENDREEIDIVRLSELRGANFGWPMFEGSLRHEEGALRRGLTFPAFEYPHHEDTPASKFFYCAGAVIGGYFAFGRYWYADYCFGEVRSFALDDPYGTDRLELNAADRNLLPNSFGKDAAGRLYIAFQQLGDDADANVLRVTR